MNETLEEHKILLTEVLEDRSPVKCHRYEYHACSRVLLRYRNRCGELRWEARPPEQPVLELEPVRE